MPAGSVKPVKVVLGKFILRERCFEIGRQHRARGRRTVSGRSTRRSRPSQRDTAGPGRPETLRASERPRSFTRAPERGDRNPEKTGQLYAHPPLTVMPDKKTGFLDNLTNVSFRPDDSEEARTRKRVIVAAGVLTPPALVGVGLTYLLFGDLLPGLIYIAFAIFVWVNILAFVFGHKNERLLVLIIGLVALPTHLSIALLLGDFVSSGGIILWGLAFPVGTGAIFLSRRGMIPFYLLFAVNLIVGVFFATGSRTNVPPVVASGILVANLGALAALLTATLAYFIRQRDAAYGRLREEQARAENLLLNILPADIAARLKVDQGAMADHFDQASILFADVVGFTPLSASLSPARLVELLNEVFSGFDTLVERYGLEKIKTIGDCYMVAAGVPLPRDDHAEAIVRLGLDIQALVTTHDFQGHRLRVRVGINSGPVVAGVIGRKKFIYDLWGDAVNIASRMESHGQDGRVQITGSTFELVRGVFECEPLGPVFIKGKGEMEVYLVAGEGAAGRPGP